MGNQRFMGNPTQNNHYINIKVPPVYSASGGILLLIQWVFYITFISWLFYDKLSWPLR